MKTRSALVLGATGMVGEPLAKALLRDGWTVAGAARFSSPEIKTRLESSAVQTFQFDARRDDPAALPDVDVLFLEIWDPMTWASNDAEFVWESNFYAVGRVVERYAGTADVVNGCTLNVYGDNPHPAFEQTPCHPTSEYGRSRFAQEKLIDYFCRRGGRRGIHVRYANANDAKQGVIRRMAEAILKEQSLGPSPDAKLQVISIEDFVRVTKAAVDHMKAPPSAVNCCHPRIWTKRELADAIRKELGRGKIVFDRERGGADCSGYGDVSRMIEWFGPPEVTWEQLIDRVVDAVNDADIEETERQE